MLEGFKRKFSRTSAPTVSSLKSNQNSSDEVELTPEQRAKYSREKLLLTVAIPTNIVGHACLWQDWDRVAGSVLYSPPLIIKCMGILHSVSPPALQLQIERAFPDPPVEMSFQQRVKSIDRLFLKRNQHGFRLVSTTLLLSRKDIKKEIKKKLSDCYKINYYKVQNTDTSEAKLEIEGVLKSISKNYTPKIGCSESPLGPSETAVSLIITGYFQVYWTRPFLDFVNRDFFIEPEKPVVVTMMRQTGIFKYAVRFDKGCLIAGVPIGPHNNFYMFFMTPIQHHNLANLIASLNVTELAVLINTVSDLYLDITIPAFKLTRYSSLGTMLESMTKPMSASGKSQGFALPDLFERKKAKSNSKSFNKFSLRSNIGSESRKGMQGHFTQLHHQLTIKVDGRGVDENVNESMVTSSSPHSSTSKSLSDSSFVLNKEEILKSTADKLIVDRPFLVAIKHTQSNAIVLLGAVTDPTAGT